MESNIKLLHPSPKTQANVLSKLFFAWPIGIFYKCVKEGLNVSDLHQNLSSDGSEKLCNLLERNWNEELQRAKQKDEKASLLRAIRKSFFLSYMLTGLILFVLTGILQPTLPVLLSNFVSSFSKDGENLQEKCLYGALLVLISFVMLFLQHHLTLKLNQIGMRVRIACCSLIYRKMLRLSQSSLNKSAAGEVVNLLSNDVSRFDLVAWFLNFFWIIPIQVAFATYLLWQEIETAAFIGVGLLIILTVPVHTYSAKLSSILRLRTAGKTDTRVKKMSEIVSGIQVIKMYAWEKPFAKIVSLIRLEEVNTIRWTSYLKAVLFGSFVFVERMLLGITVISYVLLGHALTANKVFFLANFFNILQLSLAINYPLAAMLGAETLVSIKRLQAFLLLEERVNFEKEKNTTTVVRLENIGASWVPDTKVLSHININVAPGSLCAIVGPVGAGKSTILQLLLGELVPDQGKIVIGGDISYASQEPWLFASTIRKNILFGQKYDSKRYSRVIGLCALERDLRLLPDGDRTMVGDNGVVLSGGQKARINLARAVYRNADIYLLDDPLSAVDANVGNTLFDRCIVGYLRSKTRILITHQLQYLEKADHLVVINNGKVEAQGTFSELSQSNLDFTKLLGVGKKTNTKKQPTSDRVRTISRHRKESAISRSSEISERSDSEYAPPNAGESFVNMGKSAYWQYARAGGSILVLCGLAFFMVLGQIVSNATDLWITYWTRNEMARSSSCENSSPSNLTESITFSLIEPNNYNNGGLYFYNNQNSSQEIITERLRPCIESIETNFAIYVYIGLLAACVALLLIRSIYFFQVAMNASKNLHSKMFYALLQAPMLFFDTNPSGRILNRFTRDMGIIDELLPRIMLEAVQVFLVMVGILVMVFISNVYMMAVALILSAAFYKLTKWYIYIAGNVKHLEGITRSPVFSHVSASLIGIPTIRATAAETTLMQEFDCHQDTHTSSWYLKILSASTFGLWIDFLNFLFITCLIFGFIIMDKFNPVDGSLVGLALSQSLILIGMVQHGIRQTADVVSQMTSVERILEYTALDKEGPQETTPDTKVILKNWPNQGEIRFSQVYLRYSEDDDPVLKNLNFVVKSGEKIGIVGRTGAGKSSLIAALFRLAPTEGLIAIDGVAIDNIGLNDLRRNISIIPQQPVLFSATLRYNLDPFDEYTDKEIWNALEEVELKNLAHSLEFFVEEAGNNFSVGQRQLVCLARAILRNNKILVLDEATANVDPQTDALIQETIRRKFSKCTVLTIAHRLHSVMDSDKVMVMGEGKLKEYDHPHILLSNSKGNLFGMVAQTGTVMAEQLHKIAEVAYSSYIHEIIETSHL